MSTPLLTIANQLTILRMILTPVLIVQVLSHRMSGAFAVFCAAALTDLLDGLFARYGKQKTTLGAMLDPVADKLLLGAAFITLTWTRDLTVAIPMWLTVTTLSRDVLLVISVLVVNLVVDRRIFFPSFLGKMSTVSQVVTVGLVLLLNALEHTVTWMTYVFHFTLLMTVASALHYVYLASTKNAGKGLVSESLPQ